MKHYTESIPYELAKKLKEKGMPMTLWQIGNNTDYVEVIETRQEIFDESQTYEIEVRFQLPTYAEVLDWNESQNIGIGIKHHWSGIVYQGWDWNVCQFDKSITPYFGTHYGTWHEAAEKAIEKALELI